MLINQIRHLFLDLQSFLDLSLWSSTVFNDLNNSRECLLIDKSTNIVHISDCTVEVEIHLISAGIYDLCWCSGLLLPHRGDLFPTMQTNCRARTEIHVTICAVSESWQTTFITFGTRKITSIPFEAIRNSNWVNSCPPEVTQSRYSSVLDYIDEFFQ